MEFYQTIEKQLIWERKMDHRAHPENATPREADLKLSPLLVEVHRESVKPVVVVRGKGVSRALTAAALFACSSYSKKSREKVIRWLRAYLALWPDDQTPISEGWLDATRRFEAFMKTQGCTLENPKGISRANGLILVRRKDRDLTEASLFINALEAFYRKLSVDGYREHPNPILIENWEAYEPNHRAGIMRRQNQIRRHPNFRGLRYVMEEREVFKPKLYDPSGVRTRILNAGDDWPEMVKTIFHVIADSGCRISEPLHLTAKDWWDGSQFGDVIRAPNKSSDGERVKDLLLDFKTVDRVRACFVKSGRGLARRPSMEELIEHAEKGWHAYMHRVLLFPQANGAPHTAGSLRDTYFAPTMEKHRIMLENKNGDLECVTPHVLRHARIDEEIRRLDALYPEQDRFLAELEEFAAHMHCSLKNIMDYAAGALRQRSLRYRRKLLMERAEITEKPDPNRAPTVAQRLVERMRA